MLPYSPEGQPVYRTGSELGNGCQMRGRAIPLVAGKSVFRILTVILLHDPVPRNLGNYRCRSYGEAKRVPFFYGLLMDGQGSPGYSVDQKAVRLDGKTAYCILHGAQGCLKDIDPVNRQVVADADTDRNGLAYDPVIKFGAQNFRKLL